MVLGGVIMNILLRKVLMALLRSFLLKFFWSWFSKTGLYKAIYRFTLTKIMDSRLYNWFVRDMMPKLRLSNGYTQMDSYDYRIAYDRLKEGDIILTVDYANTTTRAIGGVFSHASYCIGKDPSGKKAEIAEMVGSGYKEVGFYALCKESDRVAILRCDDWDPEYIKKVTAKIRNFVGTPYDRKFEFESGLNALYCSELIYEGDIEKRLMVSLEDLAGLGRKYISPTGLYKAKNVSVIFVSKEIKA